MDNCVAIAINEFIRNNSNTVEGRELKCAVVVSSVHHHGAGSILFPLSSLSPSWLFLKKNTA